MENLNSTSNADVVWALCEKLRSERLLLSSEMETVVQLHTQIADRLIVLGMNGWSTQQHQLTFNRLLNSHELVKPETTCKLIGRMNSLKWTEAYKRLDYHCSNFEALLTLFFKSARSTAEFLHACEQLNPEDNVTLEEAIRAVFSLVYGHCLFPSDERLLLGVLKHLIELQVVRHPDPRLLIRKGTSSFCRLYKLFNENLFPAKIFLTAALHDPVMLVLCQEDIFLDIDPAKSPLRFPTAERARRFGTDPHSSQYQKKVAQHRKIIVEKLVLLAHSFVKGINDSMACFPASLIWLVQHMYSSLVDSGATKELATFICTDLVVTNLLCPAITNPESLGIISDTPVGHITRFNLMQMGQLVQMLALLKYEQPPSHMQFLSLQFKDSPICDIVSNLLNRRLPELDALFSPIVSESNKGDELFKRTHFLGSLHEVNSLLFAVRSSASEKIKDASLRKDLKDFVKRMPSFFSTPVDQISTQVKEGLDKRNKMRQFTDTVQNARNLLANQQTASPITESSTPTIDLPAEYFDIIVFRLFNDDDRLGLQPEDKFMDTMKHKNSRKHKISNGDREKKTRFLDNASTVGSAISEATDAPASDLDDGDGDVNSLSSSMDQPQEDRMLLLDEDGTSTLPDNVSDVGAMSGRGSPSLSGRGSPLSQAGQRNQQAINEREETEAEVAAASTTAGDNGDPARHSLPPLPVTVRKQNAEGLEEKFGKFSLPANQSGRRYRDDQRSLLSDSWSTDVVASDNEGPGPLLPFPPGDNLTPGSHRPGRHAIGRSGSIGGQNQAGANEDRSDTWSLDAVASDSEADGARERDREVDREVQHNQQLQGNNPIVVHAGTPVDNLICLDPSPAPQENSNEGERLRRQSSGSSFLSRSDLDFDAGILRDIEDSQSVLSSSMAPPSVPPRPTTIGTPVPPEIPPRPLSNDRPSSSSAVFGSPSRIETSEKPGTSSFSSTNLRGKKVALFQGLRNVGDKIGDTVRKGMNSTALRQIPHSSTLSDILGSFPGEWSTEHQQRRGSEPKLPASGSQPANLHKIAQQSADDILNKYKVRKPSVVLIETSGDPPDIDAPPPPPEAPLYYDIENLSQCRAFIDAKRKLRHVLSNIGTLPSPILFMKREGVIPAEPLSERHQILRLLRVLLAEAINSREQVLSAHIREVIRVLAFFDDKGVRKLLRALREEHRKRTSYVLYLQQSRLTLLRLLAHIGRLDQRVNKERTLIRECVVEFLVRFYLDNHDHTQKRLIHEFLQLKAQDERIDLLHKTLKTMLARLSENLMWKDASSDMLDFAGKTVERVIMAQIHNVAFYPNGEADIYRDDVLHRSLARLARSITPDHPMLHIPKELQGEAPWPSAQADIEILNAFKSPRDKLQCVVRACSTISNLIALAPGAGPAAADDLTPVLVYVLIQANPPALFSNVQYVQSFCLSDMAGSDRYWWTQFTAAIEFIKTLL